MRLFIDCLCDHAKRDEALIGDDDRRERFRGRKTETIVEPFRGQDKPAVHATSFNAMNDKDWD